MVLTLIVTFEDQSHGGKEMKYEEQPFPRDSAPDLDVHIGWLRELIPGI
jgi:hypothetical protein